MTDIGNVAAGGPARDCPNWVPPLWAVGVVGLVLSPLLVGFEPIGGDPDLMYRPIKHELAAALRDGRLPYWSDHLGLGVPLVAESHAAALYPPNWIAYRFLDVPTAYRLLMWLHFVACAMATYAYARVLGISGWGSTLASVAFTLGGFQAAHACHEPFYLVMPYLPLCLSLAERYLATGRLGWLAALALSWGAQIALGHFQIQMWTGGLVALTGLARLARDRIMWRRAMILMLGLAWGLAVISVQLRLTSELTGVSGFDREAKFMLAYALPPRQLAQWALPEFYQSHDKVTRLEAIHPYWGRLGTTPEESCSYVGLVALVLACVGVAASMRAGGVGPLSPAGDFRSAKPAGSSGGTRRPTSPGDPRRTRLPIPDSRLPTATLSMWLWVSAAAMVLATMPYWWPGGYMMVLKVPGFGLFRAPGRYMILTTLGVALWAGRGLDREIAPRRFRIGVLVAIGLLIVSLVGSIGPLTDPGFLTAQGASTIPWRYAAALLNWGLALAAVLAWRRGRLGVWGPLAVAALELGALFYLGPTPWGWTVPVPGPSPMFARLRQERDVGLLAGRLQNLPVRAGFTVSYPIVGITAPPPNYLLEPSIMKIPAEITTADVHWLRRFGVTHGIWEFDDDTRGMEILAEGEDPVLGILRDVSKNGKDRQRWKLVRYGKAFPPAWVATRAKEAGNWGPLYTKLAKEDLADEAWFLPEDLPPEVKGDPTWNRAVMGYGLGVPREVDLDIGPPATSARVVDWDGRSGTVEHDGSCVLITRRAYYPGWRARIDDGPERPVSRVNGGLQGVILTGKGPSRIALSYHPTRLNGGKATSLAAVAAALLVIAGSAWRAR